MKSGTYTLQAGLRQTYSEPSPFPVKILHPATPFLHTAAVTLVVKGVGCWLTLLPYLFQVFGGGQVIYQPCKIATKKKSYHTNSDHSLHGGVCKAELCTYTHSLSRTDHPRVATSWPLLLHVNLQPVDLNVSQA